MTKHKQRQPLLEMQPVEISVFLTSFKENLFSLLEAFFPHWQTEQLSPEEIHQLLSHSIFLKEFLNYNKEVVALNCLQFAIPGEQHYLPHETGKNTQFLQELNISLKKMLQLLKAYKTARYHVNQGFSFYLEKESIELQSRLKELSASSAIFLTAYNPLSKNLGHRQNQDRNLELMSDLNKKKYRFDDGYGTDIHEEWEPEESFLIYDVKPEDAELLSRKYQQLGYVYVNSSGYATLKLNA